MTQGSRAGSDDVRTAGPEPDEGPTSPRVVAYWEGGFAMRALPSGTTITVGRGSGSDLRIDHVTVSRQHAILRAGAPATIEDVGSAHGTRIAGRALARGERAPVPAGSVVEIGRAILVVEGARDTSAANHQREGRPRSRGEVGRFEALLAVVAPSPMTVLLLGETGVGKGVIAEQIHRGSPRAAKQFLALNCGALPETLLEAELFGHEKGAFTGAMTARPGLLEAAAGGTVFLDEVGEMPPSTQVKLLRVLEEREVLRVGARRPTPIDVRFIAATNRDLGAMVDAGTFRRDLYYRLSGVPLTVPPLRERREEIAGLARTFIAQAAGLLGKPTPSLTPRALAALEAYAWPGNVRELRTSLERACLFAKDVIDIAHLDLGGAPESRVPEGPRQGTLREGVEDAERARIVAALEQTNGNQSRAAELLGVSRRTLLRRLDDYGFPRPRKGETD